MSVEQLTFAVERITPAKAERYLERNDRNRKLSARVAQRYAKAMLAGEWKLNVLRERLIQTGAEILKPSSTTKLAWVVQAWNCYRAKAPCRRLSRIVTELPRFAPDPIKHGHRR